MRLQLFCFLIILSVAGAFGQTPAESEALFNNKQYAKAKIAYQSLLKSKPKDPLYNYRYARCLYELKEYEDAIQYFSLSGSKFPLTEWYLAELYSFTYRFDESVTAYENYMSTLSADDKKLPELEKQKNKAALGAKLMKRIEDIAVIDSVVVDKNSFLKKYNFNSELGTLRQTSLMLNSRKFADKITYTTQRNDRTIFSDTIKGQTDIMSSFKQLDDWSEPVSISEVVNTDANENYPFLLLDGLTMYFASDGENSIGGFDIFITKYSSNLKGFITPENIGFPFNSPSNDYMMVIDEQRKTGWFATDRNQPAGKVMIYKFEKNDEKIIYRTENKDTLVKAAQLKLYRKSVKTTNETVSKTQVQNTDSDKDFIFIVTDSLIYTKFDDFKSNYAFKLWSEYRGLEKSAKEELENLNELRHKYESSDKQEVKEKTGKQILINETSFIELQKEITKKLLNARNEEIIFLNKK